MRDSRTAQDPTSCPSEAADAAEAILGPMRGMRPSAPTPSGRRRLSNHRRPTPPALRRAPAPFVPPRAALLGAGGEPRARPPSPRQSRSPRSGPASGQSPPGVGVKGMRPPAYAGFKKRRPPSASLRSLSGGGAIAPTPPERPPFSDGRPHADSPPAPAPAAPTLRLPFRAVRPNPRHSLPGIAFPPCGFSHSSLCGLRPCPYGVAPFRVRNGS